MDGKIRGKKALAIKHVLDLNGVDLAALVANAETIMQSRFNEGATFYAEAADMEAKANVAYQDGLAQLQSIHQNTMSTVNLKKAAATDITAKAMETKAMLAKIK